MQYEEWNRAIAEFFTRQAIPGSAVFLSLDAEVLQSIGIQHNLPAQQAVDDFCSSVRQQIEVATKAEVSLSKLKGIDANGMPRSIAFLGAMVLAATSMGQDDIDEANFFEQFRIKMGLSPHGGRPRGMTPGATAEEPFWLMWNQWLSQQGYMSTARRGNRKHRFIAYPISQALLRHADKMRLLRFFSDNRSDNRSWFLTEQDSDTLVAKVAAQRDLFSKHLRELLMAREQRFQAVAAAIYDLHSAWLSDPQAQPDQVLYHSTANRSTILNAGLIRFTVGFGGKSEYWLLPRYRGALVPDNLCVEINSQSLALIPDMESPGYFEPLIRLSESDVVQEKRILISQPAPYQSVVLPQRPFHLLCSDPDNPDSGLYASGRSLAPDTHFILLCNDDTLADMYHLRNIQMLNWEKESRLGATGWTELIGCMILSHDWSVAHLANQDLYTALFPRRKLTIGLSGGLRAPGMRAWLKDYGPPSTVYGSNAVTDVRVYYADDATPIYDAQHCPHILIELPAQNATNGWSRTGSYRIEVGDDSDPEQRVLYIADWADLQVSARAGTYSTPIENARLSGALIQSTKGDSHAPLV